MTGQTLALGCFAGCVQIIKWAHKDKLLIFPLQKRGLFKFDFFYNECKIG